MFACVPTSIKAGFKQGAYSISHKENGHSTQSSHNSDGEHWRDEKKAVQFPRTKCPRKKIIDGHFQNLAGR